MASTRKRARRLGYVSLLGRLVEGRLAAVFSVDVELPVAVKAARKLRLHEYCCIAAVDGALRAFAARGPVVIYEDVVDYKPVSDLDATVALLRQLGALGMVMLGVNLDGTVSMYYRPKLASSVVLSEGKLRKLLRSISRVKRMTDALGMSVLAVSRTCQALRWAHDVDYAGLAKELRKLMLKTRG